MLRRSILYIGNSCPVQVRIVTGFRHLQTEACHSLSANIAPKMDGTPSLLWAERDDGIGK